MHSGIIDYHLTLNERPSMLHAVITGWFACHGHLGGLTSW
ncbi:Protein of unknown function [Pyronema omphalodes CBS 100304]|uniref:Uncharacterized protein n=1 Tax=Pyronema omphalodes (strain CBS 100304) TaxID=1076935 RepID=U4LU75_PYROM|nr:Protein of unknown function [Pyronema omphalodes CBS 100304]